MNEIEMKEGIMEIIQGAFSDGYYLGKNSTPNNEQLEKELEASMRKLYLYKIELLLKEVV